MNKQTNTQTVFIFQFHRSRGLIKGMIFFSSFFYVVSPLKDTHVLFSVSFSTPSWVIQCAIKITNQNESYKFFFELLPFITGKFLAMYKTCNRTKPNRTYGNYRTYPAEPTEIIEHPDRTYGNYDLSIPGINCITC